VQFVGLAHEAITDGGGEPVKPLGVVELIGGGAARTVGRHAPQAGACAGPSLHLWTTVRQPDRHNRVLDPASGAPEQGRGAHGVHVAPSKSENSLWS